MSKRMSNKSVRRMMDDCAFDEWGVSRLSVTNEMVNAWRLIRSGFESHQVETRFISLTASELKGK